MKITWIGHSCFRIESRGAALLIDPYGDDTVPGLLPVREKAHAVITSHDHADHDAQENVTIEEDGRSTFDRVFDVKAIETCHDNVDGGQRGTNAIHIIDDGEFRLAHFGDQGCRPTDDQMEEIKGIDIALVPVGGYYTIDSDEAFEILKDINPNIIIPMHYRRDNYGFDVLGGVEDFTSHYEHVDDSGRSYVDTEEVSGFRPLVYVLKPANVQ